MTRTTATAALAAVFALSAGVSIASADDMKAKAAEAEMEKCYGVAKAGQNDCASPGSAHACAGQSKIDKDPMSWKFVPAGTCTQMGGMLQQPSK